MNAIQLTRIQLELECIGLDLKGRMVRIPGPHPDKIARFYVTRHAGGHKAYYGTDLTRSVRNELAALPLEQAFSDRVAVMRILARDAPCGRIDAFKSYVFGRALPEDQSLDVVRLKTSHRELIEQYDVKLYPPTRPVFAIIADGRIVSTCQSSRENNAAGEAWVRTLPEYRRRGYGRQVTLEWALELVAHGKIAFYSHAVDNVASSALARSLGLEQFIEGIAYG